MPALDQKDDFNFPDYFYQITKEMIFKLGQEDILKKILIIARPWIEGKETNEEFAKKLNELFNNYSTNKKI